MKLLCSILSCSLFATVAACAEPRPAAPDAGTVASASGDPVSDDTLFTETHVWTDASGTHTTLTFVTAGQERAQNAARAHQAAGTPTPLVAVDLGCSPSSLEMFDRTDWTGNHICFTGAGEVDLSNFDRYLCAPKGSPCLWVDWTVPSGSIYPSVWHGALQGDGAPHGSQFPGPDARTDFQILFGWFQPMTFTAPSGLVQRLVMQAQR